MPLYEITAPDGSVYEIEGPEGASQQSLILAAKRYEREQRSVELQRKLAEAQSRPAEKPETTVGGNVKEAFKGVVPGGIGLLERAGTGLAALLPEEAEKSTRETIKSVASAAKKPFEAAPGYEDSPGRNIGQGLGSMLPMAPLALFGPAGIAVGVGLGVAAGAGEARERAEQAGASASQRGKATALGTIPGAFDAATDMALAALPGPLKALGPSLGIIKRALASGGIEGATEAAQSVAQNAIAKGIYKPDQSLVEGSGEEGAYGAAVGTLASLLLDAAIPGRRRGLSKPAAEGEAKPPSAFDQTDKPLALGYEKTPFTPMVAPDGSVITTQAELDDYKTKNAPNQRLERQLAADRASSDPLAGLTDDQKKLARSGKESALAETFNSQDPDLLGDILPARQEVTEPEAEAPAPQRDERTRDMIDEMETADIESMVADEQRQAIAEVDQRVEDARKKKSGEERMALLTPLIEGDVPYIAEQFTEKLQQAGFRDAEPTAEEQKIIDAATRMQRINAWMDRYRATQEAEATADPGVEPSAPAENESMESLIPEKGAKPGPQGQLAIEGLGAPKGAEKSRLEVRQIQREQQAPQAFSQEELERQQAQDFPTVLTAEVLDATGLPKNSGIYKQLLNVDMADRANWPLMGSVLARVRENKFLPNATKNAIKRIAANAFGGLSKQRDLFPTRLTEARRGAKESVNAKSPAQPSVRTGNTGDDNAATGTRAGGDQPSAGKRTADNPTADPKRTQAPQSAGLGDSGKPVSDAGGGAGGKPRALTPREMLDRAEAAQREADAKSKGPTAPKEPKSEPTKEDKPTRTIKPEVRENAYLLAKQMGEVAHAIRTLAADAYLGLIGDMQPSVAKLTAMVREIEGGTLPKLKFGRTDSNGPGTNGKYAQEFYDGLNADEKARFTKELQSFLYSEIRTKQFLDQYNTAQYLARDIESGKISLLAKDAEGLATTLHPEVVRMLKDNNLTGALKFIANMDLGRSSAIAGRIANLLSGVDVQVQDFAKPTGAMKALINQQPAIASGSGAYVASVGGKRTIFLDSNSGLDVWTLLHEGVHPLVNETLDSPSHPLTKQLQQLFNDVKGSLDTAYGATDLKEFVAEAWSNPEFQQKLASINPKGEAITAWQRFVHAVKNFVRSMVGMDTKGMNSALDAADYMVEAVINGHAGIGQSLQTVSLLNKGGEFLNRLGARAESLPGLNRERVGAIHEIFSGSIPGKFKDVVRQALPLNALVEVAQKYIPMANRLDILVGERAGAENARNQKIEPIIDKAAAWAKANPDKLDAFNRVVYDSTLAQVDPTKPRSDYVGKTDSSGNKKDAAWGAMRADWNALGESGHTTYKLMRDTYRKMYGDVRAVLDNRIDGSVDDPGTRKTLKAEIYKRLFESGHIEPYFPLTRTGKYWLSYTLGNEFYVESFETGYQREAAAKELRGEGASDIEKFANLNQINYRKAPATSFVNGILRTLEANKVDAAVTEEVMRMFLNTLPETSFAQSFRKRKGTLGFQKDAIAALRSKTFSMSRQLSNMEYGAKLEKLRAEMKEYVRSQGNKDEAVDMMNELDARIDYAISPDVPMWSKLATSFGFNMTLGFNVSSALVNLSQIPLVVMPYLGGKYGYGQTVRALGRASRYFARSGFDREVEMLVATDKGEKKVKVKAFPSMDNYDFDAKDAPKHLKVLSQMAGQRGQLNRSQVYDILDVDDSQGLLTKINAASGFVFHHGERMNRQVALIAAYELELQRLVGKGKDLTKATEAQQRIAATNAIDMTELTNGGTAAAAAPRLAQNALGKVLFMYKRYGVSMYYMLFKTAREALKSADPEVRAAAKRQIAGIYASAALMAGVQGVPMYGIAAMLYNMILKEEDDDDFDTAAKKYLHTGVHSGAINALTGLEIAGRVGLSDLLFRDTNTKPSDSMIWSFAEMMGGPVIGVASRVERGLKLIADGNVERGIEQILPSAIGNGMKAMRFGTEGANTLRGDPITGEIGPWNVFAQFFGFAPAEYTRQLEINSSAKNIDRDVMENRTKLLRKYYVAMRNGDTAEAADLMAEMVEFNSRRKDPKALITPDTIQRSMAQHMKTTQEMYHGITLSKSIRGELLQHVSEFEDEE